MKDVTFVVEISFNGDIKTEAEIKELANNIAESLRHTCDTSGLAPEESETFTEHIRVRPWYSNETVIISL